MRKSPEYQFLLQNGRPLQRGSANNVLVRGFENRVPVKLHRPLNQVAGGSNGGRRLGEREKQAAGKLGPDRLPGGSVSGDAGPERSYGNRFLTLCMQTDPASPDTAQNAGVRPSYL